MNFLTFIHILDIKAKLKKGFWPLWLDFAQSGHVMHDERQKVVWVGSPDLAQMANAEEGEGIGPSHMTHRGGRGTRNGLGRPGRTDKLK